MKHTLSHREILDLAVGIGYHILKYGGEINRVEDTVMRIGLAYGMDFVHVFAIASSIVITMEKDGVSLTQTRRVRACSTNLDKVDCFNALSRRVCEETPSYQTVQEEIKAIEGRHLYPSWVLVLAYAIIGGSFSVFFGGGIPEFLAGFLAGILVRLVVTLFHSFLKSPFFSNVAGSAATVILIKLFSLSYPALNTEVATIGVLMNLVPGVLLTNCIRDFVATDYVAGTAKIIEAFFT
ncbi:MAG: threonine/serine exporter family protein, partial [Clostridia bacterium]|nr:threonine/serine exporter family protein [Clostridia bacterium]